MSAFELYLAVVWGSVIAIIAVKAGYSLQPLWSELHRIRRQRRIKADCAAVVAELSDETRERISADFLALGVAMRCQQVSADEFAKAIKR